MEEDSIYLVLKDHITSFMDSANLNANIASIKVNGEDLPAWNPEVYEYVVELPSGTTEIPALEANPVHHLSTIEIIQPKSLPGFVNLTILANDKASYRSYRIYYSVESAASNTELDSILIAGHPVVDFDPEVLYYTVSLPEGSTIYFTASAFASAPDTKIIITRPTSFPGTVIVVATSVDGSTRPYLIKVFISTGLDVNNQTNTEVIFQNPFTDNLSFRIKGASPGRARLLIFGPTGSLVQSMTLKSDVNGDHRFFLSGSGQSGLYLYRMVFTNFALTGKLIRL